MSDGNGETDVTTAAEFEDALEDLLAAAARNDVDPRGSWVCDGTLGDWEVVVYELES